MPFRQSEERQRIYVTGWAELELGQFPFEYRLCRFQLALVEADQAKHTTKGAGLWTLRVRPGFPLHGLGNLLRLTVFAAHEGSQTLSVMDGDPPRSLFCRPCNFLDSSKCRLGLFGRKALGPEEGLPIGSLEIEAAATLRRLPLHVVALSKR